jgi:thiol-disulfide isomerase/thioredoxin
MNGTKVIIVLLAIILLYTVGSIFLSENTKPPSFELENLQGNQVRLDSYLTEKIIYLNFWATWCPPCKAEMPDLNRVHKHFEERGDAVLLTINLRDSKNTVSQFIKSNGYDMNVLLDTDGSVGQMYGIRSIPTTIIIDKSGKVVDQFKGGRKESFFLGHDVLQ